MKWSKYNFLFFSKQTSTYLLYNSVSNAFIELDKHNYELLQNLKNTPSEIFQLENSEYLLKNNIFVEDDDYVYYKKKLELNLQRFSSRHLSLTIAPTDDCNFACPYCYEKNKTRYMSKDTADQIVLYAKNLQDVKSISICWYGGEPLMGFETIEYLTSKILDLNISFHATMVTNGYLMDENVSKKISDLKIQSIQVTIDGSEETHNKKRRHKEGRKTFETIIHNLKICKKINPNLNISIRVNVDESNKDEFHEVRNYFREHFNDPTIHVYHAFVDWNISKHCKGEGCGISDGDRQAKYLIQNAVEKNEYFRDFFPQYNLSQCMMRSPYSYLIDPNGDFYKCWHHMGDDEKKVGILKNGKFFSNKKLYKYLEGDGFLESGDCRDCFFLPTCSGGCPDSRMTSSTQAENLCIVAKYQLQDFLELHYQYLQSQNAK